MGSAFQVVRLEHVPARGIRLRRSRLRQSVPGAVIGQPSFKQLIGAAGQGQRDGDAERLGRLEVDVHLPPRRLLHRQISWFLALENAPGIDAPLRKADKGRAKLRAEAGLTNPITGSAGSCARTASGHAPAPLMVTRNSRRPMWTAMRPSGGGQATQPGQDITFLIALGPGDRFGQTWLFRAPEGWLCSTSMSRHQATRLIRSSSCNRGCMRGTP